MFNRRNYIGISIVTFLALCVTAVVIYPFIWVFILSFRTTGEILKSPYGLPERLDISNFIELFTDPQIAFYRYYFNSIVVTTGSLILTLALSLLGGYGFGRSRFQFKGRDKLFTLLLFSLMLPIQAMYIPQFILMSRYHLINTRIGLILLYTALGIPMSTFLLKTYFSQLPKEMEESASIDGAKDFRIFISIMMPLAKPVMATVLIYNSMYFWNELLLALTMVTKSHLRTLPLAIMNFISANMADYGMASASLVVSMLPIVILYIIMSERFVKGMTAGAIKG